MLHLIIGEGKGKTSAAAGMALRAAGHGKTVLFAQFLKDGSSGEIGVLRGIDGITVAVPTVNHGFLFRMNEAQRQETAADYAAMLKTISENPAFLTVLDEALHALKGGLISRKQLEPLLDRDGELVLTGYDPPEWLTARADYISEIRKLKHPFDSGLTAREGVEY